MPKYVRAIALSAALLAAIAAGLIFRINPCLRIAASQTLQPPPPLGVTFMGVSTLLIDDGTSAIMIDGFFSRRIASLGPHDGRIETALDNVHVSTTAQPRTLNLKAIFVNHSHFDHAMDSAVVATKTGAMLIGTDSTRNIGLGAGLAADRMDTFSDGKRFCQAPFAVTVLRSSHIPVGALGVRVAPGGDITAPLVPPKAAAEYKEGGTYAILIHYAGKRMLVQGSAGFENPTDPTRNPYAGLSTDVVYLGVGDLNGQTDTYKTTYWDRLVTGTGARRVFPVHWDDFFAPLNTSLTPIADADAAIGFLRNQAAPTVTVDVPLVLQRIEPFAGL
jgi:L-ascorbate metabolism protein UlaG (beta-lactamase superfamily)